MLDSQRKRVHTNLSLDGVGGLVASRDFGEAFISRLLDGSGDGVGECALHNGDGGGTQSVQAKVGNARKRQIAFAQVRKRKGEVIAPG